MRRASYTIPLVGFGITFVGCGDPIIAEFNATLIEDQVFPYSDTYVDPATGVTCTETYSATMAINEELQALLTLTYTYECDDGSQNLTINYSYTGTVTVVEKKAQYTITISEDLGEIQLDCSMNESFDLTCTDQDGAGWAFDLAQ